MKKYSKLFSGLAVLVSLLMLLSGCGTSKSSVSSKGTKKPYNIAVVVKIGGIPWFNVMAEGVKKAANELGVNAYLIGPSQADPAQQVKMVDDLVAKGGVNAIVVVPNDATALVPVFEQAKSKGIAILTNESPGQKGALWDVEAADSVKFADSQMDALAKYMGNKGEYAVFVGGLTVPLHNFWADTAIAYAKKKYPELKLVTDRIPCGEDLQKSYTTTLELIKAYPHLKGILALGSLGPIGAAQAIREKGLANKIAVVGTCIPSQAAQYLKDGSIKEGFLWQPKDTGYAVVYVAKRVLDGKEIATGSFEVPGMGSAIVRDKVVQFNGMIDITKDNVDSFNF